MTTFLNILLAVFIILLALGIAAAFWLRSKARKVGAYLLVASLKAAASGLSEKAATPAHEGDMELAALIARLEAAHNRGSDALKREDYVGAMEIAAPCLDELNAYRMAHPQVFQAPQQADAPAHEALPVPDAIASDAALAADAADNGDPADQPTSAVVSTDTAQTGASALPADSVSGVGEKN